MKGLVCLSVLFAVFFLLSACTPEEAASQKTTIEELEAEATKELEVKAGVSNTVLETDTVEVEEVASEEEPNSGVSTSSVTLQGTIDDLFVDSIALPYIEKDGKLIFQLGRSHTIPYPDKAQKEKVKGSVYVYFSIKKDGTPNYVKINQEMVEPKGYGFAEAVETYLQKCKWKPGFEDGKPFEGQGSSGIYIYFPAKAEKISVLRSEAKFTN